MTKNMPSPYVALKNFFLNDLIFADVFNGYFFNNKPVIDAMQLEPENTAYAVTVRTNREGKSSTETINKYRDTIRKTSLGYLAILGIENQSKIHYSMPIRKLLYDALGFSTEIAVNSRSEDRRGWTVDEFLSNVAKGTTVTPIITVVFYTGETPWDGPRSLHDMMEIDERLRPFVPDYPLYVIDMGHDSDLSFSNKTLNDLHNVLSSIYDGTADRNTSIIESSTMSLAGILANDITLYQTALNSERSELIMCEALKKRDEEIFKTIKEENEAKIRALTEENEIKVKALEERIVELENRLASRLS